MSGDDPLKHGVWQFAYDARCIASLGTYVYESLVLVFSIDVYIVRDDILVCLYTRWDHAVAAGY